jgi:hypothetical protein
MGRNCPKVGKKKVYARLFYTLYAFSYDEFDSIIGD